MTKPFCDALLNIMNKLSLLLENLDLGTRQHIMYFQLDGV